MGSLLYNFIYLLLSAPGLCCCSGFSLVVVSRANSLVAVHGLLIAVASHCRARAPGCVGFSSCRSQALKHRFSSCGSWAQLLCVGSSRPRTGIEPVPPALAGGFFTTEPPGKPWWALLCILLVHISFLCLQFPSLPVSTGNILLRSKDFSADVVANLCCHHILVRPFLNCVPEWVVITCLCAHLYHWPWVLWEQAWQCSFSLLHPGCIPPSSTFSCPQIYPIPVIL